MGWDFMHRERGESVKDILKDAFTWTNPETGLYSKVLDIAIVNLREAYLAVEHGDANGPCGVDAVVCALEYRPHDYYNFGYKAMDETWNPYFHNCPERILRLLTPNEKAQEWRDACWKKLDIRKKRARLRKGMVIRFAEPVVFSSGIRETVFRVEDPRSLILRDRGGMFYRIRRSTLARPLEVLSDFPAE